MLGEYRKKAKPNPQKTLPRSIFFIGVLTRLGRKRPRRVNCPTCKGAHQEIMVPRFASPPTSAKAEVEAVIPPIGRDYGRIEDAGCLRRFIEDGRREGKRRL